MKKQELRAALDKIRPDEALIGATLNRIEERRQNERMSDRGTSYGFTYRLASAVCALLLMIGLGVMVSQNPAIAPVEGGTEGMEDRLAPIAETGEDDTHVVPLPTDASERLGGMVSRAAEEGGDWLVVQGTLEGCFFGELTKADSEAGVAYRCTMALTPMLLLDATTPDPDASSDLSHGGEALQAEIALYDDATLQELIDSMGSVACFRLSGTVQDGQMVWQVREWTLIP